MIWCAAGRAIATVLLVLVLMMMVVVVVMVGGSGLLLLWQLLGRIHEAPLDHLLPDAGRVQDEGNVEHFALQQQAGGRLDLAAQNECGISD